MERYLSKHEIREFIMPYTVGANLIEASFLMSDVFGHDN